jgi:predicted nucleic acid-binding protein/DNA-binding MarR family transcriptional regulator
MIGDLENIRNIINSGEAVCIIGSGASCEMGLPSWGKLAENLKLLLNEHLSNPADQLWLQDKINNKKYATIFSKAFEVFDADKVIQFLKLELTTTNAVGRIYRLLTNWPFKFYLTTNFDGIYKSYLSASNFHFSFKNNSEPDINSIVNRSKNILVELHGSLDNPDSLVLTEKQYNDILYDPKKEYFRKKISEIFNIFDIVIIGYSLNDPDITFLLDQAKYFAVPEKPIYIFLADMPPSEIKNLWEHKNVRVLPYTTKNGSHYQLVEILEMLDNFIVPRFREEINIERDDSETATALYLHTKMQLTDEKREFGTDAYAVLVMNALFNLPRDKSYSEPDIINNFPIKAITINNYNKQILQYAIDKLELKSMIERQKINKSETISITERGVKEIELSHHEFASIEENFYGELKAAYKTKFPISEKNNQDSYIELITSALVSFFKQRGLALSSSIWKGEMLELSKVGYLFKVFRMTASMLKTLDEQIFFINTIAKVLEKPNKEQKEYLALLSQRYFTYHALDLDPQCSLLRLEAFKKIVWIIDSSVILPLIAKDCDNHAYALDLFNRIKQLNIPVFTTDKLLDEVIRHAKWVKQFVGRKVTENEFLRAAKQQGEYRENLFIKGYINMAVNIGLRDFDLYFTNIFPTDDYESCIRKTLEELNIQIIDFKNWPGFSMVDWGDVPYDEKQIKEKRLDIGTYKSDLQCKTEAIVVNIIRNERSGKYDVLGVGTSKDAYFISQSGVVNTLKSHNEKAFTWSPESFYRCLLTFPGLREKEDYFYDCMITQLSMNGLLIIDEGKFKNFFNDLIAQSNLKMNEIKTKYSQVLGEKNVTKKSQWYERIPDLEKPLFVQQSYEQIAEIEHKMRLEAEQKAAQIATTQHLTEKERKEFEKLKAKESERRANRLKKQRILQSRRGKKKRKK